jgi:hypothetical protein
VDVYARWRWAATTAVIADPRDVITKRLGRHDGGRVAETSIRTGKRPISNFSGQTKFPAKIFAQDAVTRFLNCYPA